MVEVRQCADRYCKYTQLYLLLPIPPLRQLPEAFDGGGRKALFGTISAGRFRGSKYPGGAKSEAGGPCDEKLLKPAATPRGGRMGCICLRTVTTARKFTGMWC